MKLKRKGRPPKDTDKFQLRLGRLAIATFRNDAERKGYSISEYFEAIAGMLVKGAIAVPKKDSEKG